MAIGTFFRAVSAIAAAMSLAVATGSVAQADSLRHRDATGDVVVTTVGSSGPYGQHVDSKRLKPDIQQFTVLHTADVVSVATTLRGLDSIDDMWAATIVTSRGDRFVVSRDVSSSEIAPFVKVFRNGYRFKCDGITATRTSSGVIAKVPTRCLGTPWRVRVGVLAHVAYSECCPEVHGDDDALRTGAFTDRKPTLSSWIAR